MGFPPTPPPPKSEMSPLSEIHAIPYGVPFDSSIVYSILILLLPLHSEVLRARTKGRTPLGESCCPQSSGPFSAKDNQLFSPALPKPNCHVRFPCPGLCKIWGLCEFLFSFLQNERRGRQRLCQIKGEERNGITGCGHPSAESAHLSISWPESTAELQVGWGHGGNGTGHLQVDLSSMTDT